MTQPLRIVFAGTPDFAARHLEALLASQHQVVAVYTQPDRPAGRGKKLQPSAVKQLALEHDLPVLQPNSLKADDEQQQLAQWQADVMVVVAYGLILPQVILDTPRLGCLNVHGSLLPRWRGAAPIQRAIWAGDQQSGVAVMKMEAGLDTGPVLLEQRCDISAKETSASLYHKLEGLGPAALVTVVDDLENYLSQAKPQDDELANYAKKLTKEEGQLDWQANAEQLERNIRAFNPWPTAWFSAEGFKGNQSAVKVFEAEVIENPNDVIPGTIINASAEGIDIACGTNALRIHTAQVPGKKPQPAATLVNGYPSIFNKGNQLD